MKRLLVIENYNFGKEYLKAAKRLGYETILASENIVSEDFKKYVDYTLSVDTSNLNETVQKIIEYYKEVKFDGVLAGHVFLMEHVALITDQLGLPSFNVDAVLKCAYKDRMRQALEESGLSNIKYFKINSNNELDKYKEFIKYPCIIKPSDGFASINVKKCNDFEELKQAYQDYEKSLDYGVLGKQLSKTALIEECIIGEEYSVETMVIKGQINVLAITKKYKDSVNEFVEIGHTLPCYDLSTSVEEKVKKYVEQIHRELNIGSSVTHTEVMVNGHDVEIVELNPRIGGDYISNLLSYALDVDMYEIVVKIAVGEDIEDNFVQKQYAAVRFIIAPKKGILTKIEGIEKIENNVKKCEVRKNTGEYITSVEDSRGRVLAFLDSDIDYEQLENKMNHLVNMINVYIDSEEQSD